MKKLLVFITMIVIVFSFSACGEKENDYDEEKVETEGKKLEQFWKEQINKNETPKMEETVSSSEMIDDYEVTNVPVEEEVDRYVPYIVYDKGCYIKDDYWYFAADVNGEDNIKWFAYDSKNKRIINKEGWEPAIWRSNATSGSSIIVMERNQNEQYNIWGAQLFDIETGEVLVTLSDNQRFIGNWEEGRCFVLEVVETFDKNTYSMGMINNKGEWVYPLSSEYPWLDSSMSLDEVVSLFEDYKYWGAGIYWFGEYLFDTKNNLISPYPKNMYPDIFYPKNAFDGFVYCYSDSDDVIRTFNIATGELVELSRNTGNNRHQNFDDGLLMIKEENALQVKYIDGTIIMECDMSSYRSWKVYEATEDKVLFTCQNESGTKYLCLMNSDGSMVFEPQKLEAIVNGSLDDCKVYLSDDKLVIASYGKCFIYDIRTRQVVNKEVSYDILGYFSEADMFVVKTSHPEIDKYRNYCYLVDINNLDTLVNPFDMNTDIGEENVEKLSDLDLIKQILGNHTDGEVFSHVVINQMTEGIEAFALTEEVYSVEDKGYADVVEDDENYGEDIYRMAGWYINGETVKRVFRSSDENSEEGFIPTWLNQEEIWVSKCPLLSDGTELIQVDWSISVYNSGCVFYELTENNVRYAFSGGDMIITEDGRILSYDYYYDPMTYIEQWDYTEYAYENGTLKKINRWTEYSE